MRGRVVLALVLASFALCRPALAQDQGLGLGVVLGEPTGISGKYWTGSTTAFAGAAAWSFGSKSAFHVHLDHLFHHYGLIKVEKGRLPLYYGIGGRVKAESDNSRVGVRVPVGLDYLVEGSPLEIFVEVAPIVELTPATGISINGGVGIRYFFGATAATGTGKSEKAP